MCPSRPLGPGEVLIRVLRTGICGTDLHIHAWDEWAAQHVPVPDGGRARVRRRGRRARARRSPGSRSVIWSAGRGTSCAVAAATAGPADGTCASHTDSIGAEPGRRVRRVPRPAGRERLAAPEPDIDLDVAAIFDPFGNAVHTALTFPVLGEDVLITGAGPIGLMAAAVVRHAGARLRGDHRRQRVPAGHRGEDGRHARRQRRRHGPSARRRTSSACWRVSTSGWRCPASRRR